MRQFDKATGGDKARTSGQTIGGPDGADAAESLRERGRDKRPKQKQREK